MNKHIIFDHLAGRATPLQKQLIATWLANPENTALYYDWLDEWENSHLQFVADDELALQKLKTRFLAEEPVARQIPSSFFLLRFSRNRLAAACIIFAILLTSAYLFKDSILYKSVSTRYGEVKSVLLPDGSQVSLNANSTIMYPRFGFGTNSRLVQLNGEADFKVVHTTGNQKFIVRTGKEVDITVLGTQFTVYARPSNTKVVLQTGKVELSYVQDKKPQKMVMKPGDMFVSNNGKKAQLQHIEHPEKLTVWKNHDFLFQGTSLQEVADMLQDTFGYEATFDSAEIAGKTISGSFHAMELRELLDAVCDLLDVKYTITGKQVRFF